jgi:hypothetical protein
MSFRRFTGFYEQPGDERNVRARLAIVAVRPHLEGMGEGDSDKPNPIEDLRKGLGLLFRAAKTTLEKLPTDQIEEAVLTSAKEVGRALENVQHSVEEQFLGKKPKVSAPPPAEAAGDGAVAASEAPKPAASASGSPPSDETKTRIG